MINDVEKNKELIKKYPFLQISDNYYKTTWLDGFPIGWYDISLQMCEELKATLGKYINGFHITDTKEKWGRLTCYYWVENTPDSISREVYKIIDKYEDISTTICQVCGQPSTHCKNGWIGYFCDEHFEG